MMAQETTEAKWEESAPPSFGEELRRLRKHQGLSLSALACLLHYSKGYLSKIENGAKPPTLDLARRCEQALQAKGALVRLVEHPTQRGRVAARDERTAEVRSFGQCPYRGLAAFESEHAGWFFGRERATAELVSRLTDRFGSGPLLLVAPSGAGKSSLLKAGLVPALRRGALPGAGSGRWPVAVCTPTAHPLKELLQCVAVACEADLGISPQDLLGDPGRLARGLRGILEDPWTSDGEGGGEHRWQGRRLVLVVDQFEESFTLCTDEAERRAFILALLAIAGPAGPAAQAANAGSLGSSDSPVEPTAPVGCAGRGALVGWEAAAASGGVVLGMRADFCGRFLEHPELAAVLTHGLYALAPMTDTELRACITRPAEQAGLQLEAGLAELLLRDVGTHRGSQPLGNQALGNTCTGATGASSGALPLLSHALLATWQQRQEQTLTVAGYETTGGIHGAIARTAENVFTFLSSAEQDMARHILVRLVHLGEGGEETRRRTAWEPLLEQLPDPAAAGSVLDAFIRGRLLTVDRDTVEITHEALLRAWPRLRGWIDANRAGLLIYQQLAEAAAAWERERRDPAVLYRGSRLATAAEWAATADRWAELSVIENAFLDASWAEERRRQETARRHTRRQRRLLVVLTALLTVAMGASFLAYQQRSTAVQQRRIALSRAMAAQSAAMAVGQPEASMLVAAAAWSQAPTTEARGAVLSTQTQPFAGRLTGHQGPVNAVAFSPDGALLATASSDGTVRLWRVFDRGSVATLTGHHGKVFTVAFSPDGRTLASGGSDGTVRLWDVATQHTVALLAGHHGVVRTVAFSPDGRTLASGGVDSTIELWDVQGQRMLADLTGHSGGVNTVAFAPDGRLLASGSSDRTVKLWDTTSHQPVATLTGHTDVVLGVAFSPDGRTLASGGSDRTVRLWDTASHQPRAVLTGPTDDVNAVAFTPDGATVLGATGDGTVKLWDTASHRITATLAGHTDYVMDVAVNYQGNLLATASFDGSAALWDLNRATLRTQPFTEIWKTAFSPDSHILGTACGDGTVRLWDVARRQQLAVLVGHEGTVFSVAFSPDGRLLASGGADGTVRLWDVARHRQLDVLTGHSDFVNDVAFSSDGRTLASGSDDQRILLWDVARRRQLAALTGHTGAVRSVAFSPDSRVLASGSNDGTIRLWDVARHCQLAVLTGHTGAVRSVAFSFDGQTLGTAGADGTVRLWDVSRQTLTASLTGHSSAVWSVAFSSDSRVLASGSNDGTVRLWDPSISDQFTRICRLTGTINRARWQQIAPGLPYQANCTGT
ncbi:MAG: helix-turn-helix domain-containing protein [Streptomycetaceae bacterium]|nr:helix-turn-helix domain-containing protein [Streptomycetaceae bacterium]